MSVTPDGKLKIFTIYHRPIDYPDTEYVVRAFAITSGEPPIPLEVMLADSLEHARAMIPLDADTCIGRNQADQPHIVETWI